MPASASLSRIAWACTLVGAFSGSLLALSYNRVAVAESSAKKLRTCKCTQIGAGGYQCFQQFACIIGGMQCTVLCKT